MLTEEQEKWLAHLSDTEKAVVKPFDPLAVEIFEAVKRRIQTVLGSDVEVAHHGATSLGISGQDEIDVYLSVAPVEFERYVELVKQVYGDPKSVYPLERVRFATEENGKHIDIFVVNKKHQGYRNSIAFKQYLLAHPEALKVYEKMKEDASGQSVREYYRRKLEFIDAILTNVSDT